MYGNDADPEVVMIQVAVWVVVGLFGVAVTLASGANLVAHVRSGRSAMAEVSAAMVTVWAAVVTALVWRVVLMGGL